MNVFDKARVVIYRYHEKGLEVFLIEPKAGADEGVWKFPKGDVDRKLDLIHLDVIQNEKGENYEAFAVEGDWHNIPSIRGLIKHDVKRATNKISEIEKGTFIALKDAFKKVLPNEYAALKELKDVLMEKTIIRNI